MTVAIQGVAAEFKKIFTIDGKKFYYLAPDCFGPISDVDLLLNHQGKSFATTEDRLQIYSGDDALVFRCYFPENFAKQVADQTDEIETYLAVSAGFTITKTETVICDGILVNVIVEAKLNELSLLDKPPAIDTTYARIVSEDSCGTLEEDYDRIRLVGRVVSLHRKALATESGGKIQYHHSPTAYERASDRFSRALAALA